MAEQNTNKIEMTAEQEERASDPNQIDETVPGGRYIVGDRVVNAEGEDLGSAKVETEEAKPAKKNDK